jgi:hypothetical protein
MSMTMSAPVDPSGRFEDFFDVVKPGNLLFPFLHRRVEGRALRAMAPAASLAP